MLTAKKISLTLTYLVCGGCFLSLYGIADTFFLIPLGFFLVLGLLNDFRFEVYPPRWLLNLSGILLSLLFLLELSLENLIKPFANVLLLLIVIKSLEDKKPRDIYQMLLLSLFGVAITTTFRFDPSFLAFFFYELFLGIVAFVFTNVYANVGDKPLSREFLKKYLRFSLIFPLVVAVASVPFFFLLPRTQTPLFDLFAKKERGLVSGIADQVELGRVGEIQEDNTVVMRVYGKIPPDPYWRVSVFDTFLGNIWVKSLPLQEVESTLRKGISYTIILEPTYDTFLPLLDYPLKVLRIEGIKANPKRLRGGYYELKEPVKKPVRYKAISTLYPPDDPPLDIHYEVPPEVSPKVRALAEELSKGAKDPEEKVRTVVEFFKRGFSYTLKLEGTDGDPLEVFLFEKRKGNCEYFASATALLLRLMGVPSRVVGGFKGVIRNHYGDYYIVTNSMAHVWVEAYVRGRWLRIDTTPPYTSPALREISKLDLLRDALISFWYENVVDFSAEKQASLFKNLYRKMKGIHVGDIFTLFKQLIKVLIVLTLGFAMVYLYMNRIRKTPRNLYRLLISKLERKEKMNFKDLLPEEVLDRVRGRPYYREVEFIIDLYRRYRFSPHEVTKRELEEGYRVLRKI